MSFKATCPRCTYGNFQDFPFSGNSFECRSCGFEFNPELQCEVVEDDRGWATVSTSPQSASTNHSYKIPFRIIAISTITIAAMAATAFLLQSWPSTLKTDDSSSSIPASGNPPELIQQRFREIEWHSQPDRHLSMDGAWRGNFFQGTKRNETSKFFGLRFESIGDFRARHPRDNKSLTYGPVLPGFAGQDVVSESSPATTYLFHKQFGFYKWIGYLDKSLRLADVNAAVSAITQEVGVPAESDGTEGFRMWWWEIPPITVILAWWDFRDPTWSPVDQNYIEVFDNDVVSRLSEERRDSESKNGF